MIAIALHLVACVLLLASAAFASGDFGARLSPAGSAMEYWDVTAWFESGERLSARWLITNQGPGTRTAAAVGHLLRANGEIVPIKFGRMSDRWTLSDDRRRLKVASAVLDLSGPTFRVEVDSDKHGVKVWLEMPGAAPIRVSPIPHDYNVDVLLPVRAHGKYLLRGMAASVALAGTAALTHTVMEMNEADLVVQRAELFGTVDDAPLYVNQVTRADGERRAAMVARHGGAVTITDDATVVYEDQRSAAGDADYVVARRWQISDESQRVVATLRREYLRWDPLEILPQPFRLLLSLQGSPRRAWADAEVEVSRRHGDATADGPTRKGTGIGVVTFARPGTMQ